MSSTAILLRKARADAGLTQAQLAARAGLTQSTIARLERGGANPTIATLDNVIAATGHRLVLAAEPHRPSFDEGQLLERLAMTPAERLANFTVSSRNLGTLVRRGASASERPLLSAGEMLRRLVERGVDFVVTGGIAALLHGSARNTFDLDIWVATDGANLAALDDAFVTSLGELDVLARPSGASVYEELRRHADRYDLGGFNVSVASIDDLIAMKQAAGRPKDLLDIEELEAIKRLRRRE
ncbi:MAG: helix-turn-helix domain-containing protein [Solirubrobacteraceae bacterium]